MKVASSIRPVLISLGLLIGLFGMARVSSQNAQPIVIDDNNGSVNAAEKGGLALEELQAFVNAFTQIRNTYVEEVDDKVLLRSAIKGMLMELDPHSNYLEPQSFEDLQVNATGQFGGLGLEVGMEDGFVKVISPIDDTPAQMAGIESGDLIIKIDNKPVKGMSLNEAVSLMRGEVGTDIALTVIRAGVDKPLEITLTRDIIEVISVRRRFIEDEYLYLRIAQFQGNTGNDLKNAVHRAAKQNTIKGIVLDLRNNPGGVLQAAVEVVDLFIDEGLIVYTEGRIQESATRFDASSDGETITQPLIVLINGGSASASEIVAGALQDHNRAIVVGTQSFGKGSVQSVIPLSNKHGMKLTTARYFTPAGRSIQAQGIVPDITVERGKIISSQDRTLEVTEADLHGHLENSNGGPEHNGSRQNKDQQALISGDTQLYQAITLLKGLDILNQRDATELATQHSNGTATKSDEGAIE